MTSQSVSITSARCTGVVLRALCLVLGGEKMVDIMAEKTPIRGPAPESACRQAEANGIDLSLLIDNLRLSPYERMQRHDNALTTTLELRQAMLKAQNHA